MVKSFKRTVCIMIFLATTTAYSVDHTNSIRCADLATQLRAQLALHDNHGFLTLLLRRSKQGVDSLLTSCAPVSFPNGYFGAATFADEKTDIRKIADLAADNLKRCHGDPGSYVRLSAINREASALLVEFTSFDNMYATYLLSAVGLAFALPIAVFSQLRNPRAVAQTGGPRTLTKSQVESARAKASAKTAGNRGQNAFLHNFVAELGMQVEQDQE